MLRAPGWVWTKVSSARGTFRDPGSGWTASLMGSRLQKVDQTNLDENFQEERRFGSITSNERLALWFGRTQAQGTTVLDQRSPEEELIITCYNRPILTWALQSSIPLSTLWSFLVSPTREFHFGPKNELWLASCYNIHTLPVFSLHVYSALPVTTVVKTTLV